MKSQRQDVSVAAEMSEGTIRQVDWGGITVETGDVRKTMDLEPLFKGSPDDRCQCPHWGYVIKGTMRYRFADREEVYNAGDVYYAAPGHTPVLEGGCEYVEFSPSEELAKTMAVVESNMAAQK